MNNSIPGPFMHTSNFYLAKEELDAYLPKTSAQDMHDDEVPDLYLHESSEWESIVRGSWSI